MQENDYPVMLKCGGMFFEVPAGIMNGILTVDGKMTPWGNCFECRYETVFGRFPKKLNGRLCTNSLTEDEIVPCTYESTCKYIVEGCEWKVCASHDELIMKAVEEGMLDKYNAGNFSAQADANV